MYINFLKSENHNYESFSASLTAIKQIYRKNKVLSLTLNIQNKEIVEIQVSCQHPRAFVEISSLTLLFNVAVFTSLYIYSIENQSKRNITESVINVYGVSTCVRTRSPMLWGTVKESSRRSLEKKSAIQWGMRIGD